MLISSDMISDNDWHHIIATWDGTVNLNGKKIYIDGILSNQKTSTITEIGTPDYSFRIGTSGIGLNDFNGLIDNIRIYNISPTITQVKELYAREAGTYDSKNNIK